MITLKHWKGDLFGGLTAGVVALPLALAFGVASGLGAIAGIYGAITLGIVAAIFGGTHVQISGPTGPMTVISASVVAANIDPATGVPNLPLTLGTFLLAGVFETALGFMRVGSYIRYVPYPVVSGFMTGIGVIIILLQLFPFFGAKSPTSKPLEIVQNIPLLFSSVNLAAVLLALATIAIIYILPRLVPGAPASLVALIVVTGAAYALGLQIPKIGEIPRGLPDIALPHFGLDTIQLALVPALALGLLGAIDSLLTSVVADNLTKTKHDSNRELVGQGVGNILAALIGGIPGAGATMRTVVNIQAGGKTRISGVIHGAFLLAVLLGAGALAEEIPMAVLAGILITVGIGIMDYRGLGHITKVPRPDALIMILVLLLTIFADLIVAVAVGVVAAAFVFMKRMGDIAERQTRVVPLHEEQPWEDELNLSKETLENIYIKHIEGPLFFGFAAGFQQIAQTLPKGHAVVLRFDRVPYIDQTGLYALDDIVKDLTRKGLEVWLVGVREEHLQLFRSIDLVPGLIPETAVFGPFEELRRALQDRVSSAGGGR